MCKRRDRLWSTNSIAVLAMPVSKLSKYNNDSNIKIDAIIQQSSFVARPVGCFLVK